jgi:DNA-binding MarR family transcriptional regulator
LEEASDDDITPVQYAALRHLLDHPGIDQITLAGHIAIDRSTVGNVVQRMEAKGLLRRKPGVSDRRTKLLYISSKGRSRVLRMEAGVTRTQERLLEPLDNDQRALFQEMLRTIANAHNQYSRVPERFTPLDTARGKDKKKMRAA